MNECATTTLQLADVPKTHSCPTHKQ